VDDVTDPQFRWLEQGAGEPMLFLHGLMGQMHHWGAVIEGLSPLGRPIALSLPILDPALRDVSIDGVMRHVRTFLDALDIPRAVVGSLTPRAVAHLPSTICRLKGKEGSMMLRDAMLLEGWAAILALILLLSLGLA